MVAYMCAAVAGFCAWSLYEQWVRKRRRRQELAAAGEGEELGSGRDGAQGVSGLQMRAIAYAERVSHGIELGAVRCFLPRAPNMPVRFTQAVSSAGVQDSITYAGYRESRLRIAGLGCIVGALMGAVFSFELTAVLGVAGAVLGWRLLPKALKARADSRARELERRLPEMLDVLAMGMRSGLSFDGSLTLYERHFDTTLARELSVAQRQWSCGLTRRDEALRAIAATYDSFLFKRVVDNILRSLRFGTSLTDGLEAVAREARADHKAHRQEQVAKVPIKMMVPTGALMLPAMLILVLGPVLLELAGNI